MLLAEAFGVIPELGDVLPNGFTGGFLGRNELVDRIYATESTRVQARSKVIHQVSEVLGESHGQQYRTMAPTVSAHTGAIRILDPGGNSQNITESNVDAMIIHHPSLIRAYIHARHHLIMGVADCVIAIIWTDDGEYIAMAHLSNQTELGWSSTVHPDDSPSFQGSLLRRIFQVIPATHSQVWLLPHIGAGDCWCYEYSDRPGQPHATILKECLALAHPDVSHKDLWRDRPEDDKCDVRWGELMVRILESLGVSRARIHPSTECTFCHPQQLYYSDRMDRKLPGLERYRRNLAWLIV
ncbi:hypothetical protein A2V68_02195 [candidate division Kazan bacterium RBG_13_50_9]|uniref:Uncharacterized protein n=1 Tax=candidate division Kazan bacterium RBG_13_50_9 TaxID=1798535 RepID=A0A1F4NRK8_UNCK3|nr:MAG: hypothetical protein A2V68_02195 [candidate division Kazan bacterium RBG_13_50_9]